METKNTIENQKQLVQFLSHLSLNRDKIGIKSLVVEFLVDENKINSGGCLTKFTLE